MGALKKIKYKKRALQRCKRLIFMSPAELQLVRIMGGKAVTVDLIRDPFTQFPFTWVYSMGAVFKAENIKREVRVGAYYADFAVDTPYYKKAILVDGARWHDDIVLEMKRDEYYAEYGYQTLHLPAKLLWQYPNTAHDQVVKFLSR